MVTWMQWRRTALMYSTEQRDEEICDLLIIYNADVMMKDTVSFI